MTLHPKDREMLVVVTTGALLITLLLVLVARLERAQSPLATPRPPSDTGRHEN